MARQMDETDGRLETIGERVRKAREAKGWLGVDLAKAAKISDAAVYQVENGINTGHVRTIAKIAVALGVSMDWLIGREGAQMEWVPKKRG